MQVVIGFASGALGGAFLIFMERFLFRPVESAQQIGITGRIIVHLFQKATGREVPRCPRCKRRGPRLMEVYPDKVKRGMDDFVRVVVGELECAECGHTWIVENEAI